jgi:hypothetical protein
MSRTRWLVAALLAACLLGACGDGDPKPDIPDPTPTGSPATPASADSSAAPESPEDAVRAWVNSRNVALASGDTAELRSLTDASCESCLSLITSIEDVYAAGGHYETTGWDVKSAKARSTSTARPTVDAAVVFAGGTTVNSAGDEPVRYGPENHIMVFKLHRAGDSLVVDFVGFLS